MKKGKIPLASEGRVKGPWTKDRWMRKRVRVSARRITAVFMNHAQGWSHLFEFFAWPSCARKREYPFFFKSNVSELEYISTRRKNSSISSLSLCSSRITVFVGTQPWNNHRHRHLATCSWNNAPNSSTALVPGYRSSQGYRSLLSVRWRGLHFGVYRTRCWWSRYSPVLDVRRVRLRATLKAELAALHDAPILAQPRPDPQRHFWRVADLKHDTFEKMVSSRGREELKPWKNVTRSGARTFMSIDSPRIPIPVNSMLSWILLISRQSILI